MRILMISGSTRRGSSNTATIRTAAVLVLPGVRASVYDGMAGLPAFNPDDDHDPLPESVAVLRNAVADADAVLLCTPEYAGTLPGSFKNLLDWLVGSVVISDKPTAWISVAAQGRGEGAHDTLRMVLGYIQARIVEPACVRIPLSRNDIGDDGRIASPSQREQIVAALSALVAAV